MVQKILTKKDIKEMCEWLNFYDIYGYLPFEKKKIAVTISGNNFLKISKLPNKSQFIDNLLSDLSDKNKNFV